MKPAAGSVKRLSPQCLGGFKARSLARRSLCWMLLGVDDVVVRWRRDERVMDGGYCDVCVRGENRQRASCVARSRRWSYRRWLVADAAYVRVRSFADIRRFGSLANITYPKRVRLLCARSLSPTLWIRLSLRAS